MTNIKGSLRRAINFLHVYYQFPPNGDSEEYAKGHQALTDLRALRDAAKGKAWQHGESEKEFAERTAKLLAEACDE